MHVSSLLQLYIHNYTFCIMFRPHIALLYVCNLQVWCMQYPDTWSIHFWQISIYMTLYTLKTLSIYTVYTWRFRCLCPELRTYKISPVPWQFAGGLWSLSYIDRKPYEVTTNVVRFYRILTDSATNGRGDLADDKIKS